MFVNIVKKIFQSIDTRICTYMMSFDGIYSNNQIPTMIGIWVKKQTTFFQRKFVGSLKVICAFEQIDIIIV